MIIYSVMPMEMIMKNLDSTEYHYQEAEIEGVKMLVEPVPHSTDVKIVRLMSPNPQDYLNPKYMPGQTIHFRPAATLS
ncbi:YlzJ-like family protein [Ammoniphilus sp. 3BR4]|uniref:YlzJ-like family protein n=1 Tax=Ammoniphilus sp. 3BR4 TaxID=3158265 RepID=UPI0034674C53